jgi:hypothetical protein
MSWIFHKVRQMRVAAKTLLVVISGLSSAAAGPQQRPSTMIDVALSADGHLISHCEDTNGNPVSNAIVELVRDRDMISWTTSRSDGSFVIRDVKPGAYRLQCGDCDRTIRVWSETTAPPAARAPIVIVVGAAPLAALSEDMLPPAVSEPTPLEQEPVLPLELQEGMQRRTGAAVEQSVTSVSSPATEDVLLIESSVQSTHAHHTFQTAEVDAPFDPFAGSRLDPPQPGASEFVDLADEPLGAPVQPQPLSAEPAPAPAPAQAQAPVARPVPQEVPCPGNVRYIRRSVGPTVGDVVVTSFGIAGITMGLIGIHKYENRKVRRVVSP